MCVWGGSGGMGELGGREGGKGEAWWLLESSFTLDDSKKI